MYVWKPLLLYHLVYGDILRTPNVMDALSTTDYNSHEESIENNGNIMYIVSILYTYSTIDIKCLCARKGSGNPITKKCSSKYQIKEISV